MSRLWTVLLRMSIPRTSLLRRSLRPDLVVADVEAPDLVVLDLTAVDEAGRDAVGDAAQRDEQGDQRDDQCRRRAPAAATTSRDYSLEVSGVRPRSHQHASAGIGAGGRFRRKGDHEAGAAALRVARSRRCRRGPSSRRGRSPGRGRCRRSGRRRRRRGRSARTRGRACRAARRARGPPPRGPPLSPSRRTDTVTGVPGGRVDERVLDQVAGQPVEVVGDAVHDHRARAASSDDRVVRTTARRPRAPPRSPRRPGRPAPRGASRPASARASSSRSPTSRRMRREERSAESAMSRCSPASSASSSSRLARMLVSGVRSSCEASATNLRWRVERGLGLLARGAQLAEHVLEGVREVGHLVVGLRLRQRDVRVARAGDLARGAGEARRSGASRAGPRRGRRGRRAACRRGRRRRGTAARG